MRARAALAAAALGAGCATFEDPQQVIDLRVLAMTATEKHAVPRWEYVVPSAGSELMFGLPPDRAWSVDYLIEQLELAPPAYVHVFVADPGSTRDLHWSASLCVLGDDSRCDAELPEVALAGGVLADPEATPDVDDPVWGTVRNAGVASIEIPRDARLLGVLAAALERDVTRGLGGLDYGVSFRVGRAGDAPDADVFAAKRLRVSPRLPSTRSPNLNPSFAELSVAYPTGEVVQAARGHCATGGTSWLRVRRGQTITLFPQEIEGSREEYYVITLEGQLRMLTEHVSYQWLATHGRFADEFTGGPPDLFGNVSLNGTQWTAPGGVTGRVPIWLIQRDDRLGATMFETCFEVIP